MSWCSRARATRPIRFAGRLLTPSTSARSFASSRWIHRCLHDPRVTHAAATTSSTTSRVGTRASSAGFWTLDRVADALGSVGVSPHPRGSAVLSGVSTDTRTVGPGNLFVALRGERFDAHAFLAEAVGKGAAAVVV